MNELMDGDDCAVTGCLGYFKMVLNVWCYGDCERGCMLEVAGNRWHT